MGRHPLKKNYSNSANAINRIAPTIKYQQASKLADKNSRTITKISQLMEISQLPGHTEADPKDRIGSHIAYLRSRLNRRLKKLAKWADSSADERHAEFKSTSHYPYKTLVKPMIYSKPTINPIKLLPPGHIPSVILPVSSRSFTTRSSGISIQSTAIDKSESQLESNQQQEEEADGDVVEDGDTNEGGDIEFTEDVDIKEPQDDDDDMDEGTENNTETNDLELINDEANILFIEKQQTQESEQEIVTHPETD